MTQHSPVDHEPDSLYLYLTGMAIACVLLPFLMYAVSSLRYPTNPELAGMSILLPSLACWAGAILFSIAGSIASHCASKRAGRPRLPGVCRILNAIILVFFVAILVFLSTGR